MNNITAWTGLTLDGTLRKTEERSEWTGELSSGVWSILGSRKTERRRRRPRATI